jgi:hypothetical protein
MIILNNDKTQKLKQDKLMENGVSLTLSKNELHIYMLVMENTANKKIVLCCLTRVVAYHLEL